MAIPLLVDAIILLACVIVGAILLMVLSALIAFLPAIVAAVVVWWIFHSLTYAGLAFLVVAILWALLRRKK